MGKGGAGLSFLVRTLVHAPMQHLRNRLAGKPATLDVHSL